MARTGYDVDLEIQHRLFGEGTDMDLYSVAQITDIVAADFVKYAEADADFYLAGLL